MEVRESAARGHMLGGGMLRTECWWRTAHNNLALLRSLHVEENSMMYYALTINADQIITGVHESLSEFTDKTFANSPEFAGQMVTSLKDKAEYQERIDIRCFDKKGKLRSQVWRIGQGYEKLPEGAEIIDGVLVTKETTIEEAPPTLMERKSGSLEQK